MTNSKNNNTFNVYTSAIIDCDQNTFENPKENAAIYA